MSIEKERRRYFRVSDLVGLNYRILSGDERDLALSSQPNSLGNLFATIEEEITVLLHAIEKQNPEHGRIFELFNQKINLAFGHGIAEQNIQASGSTRACEVSLSACGIAFPCREDASLGQSVALDLTLYPSNVRLQLMSSVISCERYDFEGTDEPYLLRADFVNLSDNDQELLVQHVIKCQAHQLKDQRADA